MAFCEDKAYITCGFCGSRIQRLYFVENLKELEVDEEALREAVKAHWEKCTEENPLRKKDDVRIRKMPAEQVEGNAIEDVEGKGVEGNDVVAL